MSPAHKPELIGALRLELEIAIGLLERALEYDASRRWWQPPDRLWVGRADHALGTLLRARELLR